MKRNRAVQESIASDLVLLVAAAIVKEGKVLVVREEAEPYHGSWVLPQGHVKNGEGLPDAAAREVREEVGIQVEMVGIVGVYEDFATQDGQTTHLVIVCFEGRQTGDNPVRSTPEVIDSAWRDPSEEFDGAPQVVRRILKDVAATSKRRLFASRRGPRIG